MAFVRALHGATGGDLQLAAEVIDHVGRSTNKCPNLTMLRKLTKSYIENNGSQYATAHKRVLVEEGCSACGGIGKVRWPYVTWADYKSGASKRAPLLHPDEPLPAMDTATFQLELEKVARESWFPRAKELLGDSGPSAKMYAFPVDCPACAALCKGSEPQPETLHTAIQKKLSAIGGSVV